MSDEYRNIIEQYRKTLAQDTGLSRIEEYVPPPTVAYKKFKEQFSSLRLNWYERICKFSVKLGVQVDVPESKRAEIAEYLRVAHLNITTKEVYTAQIMIPAIIALTGMLISVIFGSIFFAFFFILFGAVLFFAFAKAPQFLATQWRLSASNQMVLCVFYIVTYMKHTSNLEQAIRFAAQYLSGPLATDLARVLEDGLTSAGSVQEALSDYLTQWQGYNDEFIHSLELAQRSLLEGTEERRQHTLDRALTEILEETQEKMLHYAQDLKSQIMTLHMLGIVLPILGLVILPLMVSFMPGVKWYHIAVIYNIVLPIIVYLWGKNALNKRPTGYGDTDLSETNVHIDNRIQIPSSSMKWFSITPRTLGIIVAVVLLFLALSPLILHLLFPTFDVTIGLGFDLIGYRESSSVVGEIIGPFGIGASILSLFFPLSIAFGFGLYYKHKVKNIWKVRNESKKVEDEFGTALYQLGNVLAQDKPLERAFPEAAQLMRTGKAGEFFRIVSLNLSRGMTPEDAIFNPTYGAMINFPSNVINSSMRILVEATQKSSYIGAQALWGISQYIKNIHRVNERLRDLLADVISDMKSQISFLTPAIAGIVIGITSMITFILGSLSKNFQDVNALNAGTTLGNITNLFGDGLPTYYFQLIVGIYVVQIVMILTVLRNGIENGADDVGEKWTLSKNLLRSPQLYCLISLIVMVLFNLIAAVILSQTLATP